jgi:hypothetical protein
MRKDLTSLRFAFEISRSIIFEVSYYRLGSNKNKKFTTSANLFNKPKTDYNKCGQAQDDLLKGYPLAMNFYKKWDKYHLKDLTGRQYLNLLIDVEKLKSKYNYLFKESDESFRFYELKELSKLIIK